MADLSHDALAEDLAAHLAGWSVPMMVWTDMQLGPAGSARPDVYTIEKTYTALRARVFEVKVSRSDFLADITSGKYLRYAAFAGSITFAAPVGLINRTEVPEGCGLITRSEDGAWRHQRKPTMQPTPELPRDAWLKLVIDGCAREREVRRVEKCGPRETSEWLNQMRMRELAGAELGAALADRDRALHRFQSQADHSRRAYEERMAKERGQIAKEREDLDQLIGNAAKALGLPEGSDLWEVRRELDARIKGDAENRIERALNSVSHAIDGLERCHQALKRMTPAEASGHLGGAQVFGARLEARG